MLLQYGGPKHALEENPSVAWTYHTGYCALTFFSLHSMVLSYATAYMLWLRCRKARAVDIALTRLLKDNLRHMQGRI